MEWKFFKNLFVDNEGNRDEYIVYSNICIYK